MWILRLENEHCSVIVRLMRGRECERVIKCNLKTLHKRTMDHGPVNRIIMQHVYNICVNRHVRRHYAKDCRDSISEVSQLGEITLSSCACLLPALHRSLEPVVVGRFRHGLSYFRPCGPKKKFCTGQFLCVGRDLPKVSGYRSFGFFQGLCSCFASYRDKWSFKLLDVIQEQRFCEFVSGGRCWFLCLKIKDTWRSKGG